LSSADGYSWFEGRKKEIIVRAGPNMSPQEVEEVIDAHPAVLEVAVIGMADQLAPMVNAYWLSSRFARGLRLTNKN
jgi:acyl-coenzyme A synthetase/AMP-(fatty) acid ligase